MNQRYSDVWQQVFSVRSLDMSPCWSTELVECMDAYFRRMRSNEPSHSLHAVYTNSLHDMRNLALFYKTVQIS